MRAVALATASALLAARAAGAQLAGTRGAAAVLPASDAVALGARPGSLGVHVGQYDLYVHAAGPVGRGSLRGAVGVGSGSGVRTGEIGYAVPLAARPHAAGVAGAVTLGAEARLATAFRGTPVAARAAIPVGVRWGVGPDGTLALYVAPYAEATAGRVNLGPGDRRAATNAAGVGAGARLGLGRLGVEAAVRDVAGRGERGVVVGATVRPGR